MPVVLGGGHGRIDARKVGAAAEERAALLQPPLWVYLKPTRTTSMQVSTSLRSFFGNRYDGQARFFQKVCGPLLVYVRPGMTH